MKWVLASKRYLKAIIWGWTKLGSITTKVKSPTNNYDDVRLPGDALVVAFMIYNDDETDIKIGLSIPPIWQDNEGIEILVKMLQAISDGKLKPGCKQILSEMAQGQDEMHDVCVEALAKWGYLEGVLDSGISQRKPVVSPRQVLGRLG